VTKPHGCTESSFRHKQCSDFFTVPKQEPHWVSKSSDWLYSITKLQKPSLPGQAVKAVLKLRAALVTSICQSVIHVLSIGGHELIYTLLLADQVVK